MPTQPDKSIRDLLDLNFDRAFGLDISDSSIEAAELSKVFEYSLRTYGRLDLPEGAIVDGSIRNETALADSIKALLRSLKPKVSTNKAVVSLPENQILIHHFTVNAASKGNSVRFMVETEIAKLLPVAPSKMYWDIKTTPLGGGSMGVIFVGIRKEIADAYVRVCNSIGLEVVSFGLEPLCIARLFLDPGKTLSAIIDIGAQVTNISIVRGNDELDLAVSVPSGGNHMTQAIAESMHIAPAEAEKLKLGPQELPPPALAAVGLILQTIINEANKTLRYYEESYGEAIPRVLVVGGASAPAFVIDALKKGIPKEMVIADRFRDHGVPHPFHMRSKDALQSGLTPMSYTTVIGLGMLGASNEFGDINLLKVMPPLTTNRFKKSDLFKVGYLSKAAALRIYLQNRTMLVIAVLLCLLGLASFGYSIYAYRLNADIAELAQAPQVKLVHPLLPDQTLPAHLATSTPQGTSTSSRSGLTATSSKARSAVSTSSAPVSP